jgi:serpin B
VTEAHTGFGLSVFQGLNQAAQAGENLFISPLSIATALTMTVNGARAQTQTDMMSTLKIGALEMETVNKAYKQLLEVLPALDQSVQLQIANSIWYRQGFPVKQAFLDVNAGYYQSQINALDFADPAAVNLINTWVNEHTNGLIDSIVDNIPPEIIMYLINAVYFKGEWTRPFDPEMTRPADFTRSDGTKVTTDLMTYGETTLPFFQNEEMMMADLPYGDSVFTMTVLLPKEGYYVDDLINGLDLPNWQNWTGQLQDAKLYFAMPKFKFAYKEELKPLLKQLGMEIAFTGGQADFGNIADAELYIDGVLHKAFVEVNEEGTEAAAVTSVSIGVTSVPNYPYMILNRPFVFVIRENQTNEILFLGKLADPSVE